MTPTGNWAAALDERQPLVERLRGAANAVEGTNGSLAFALVDAANQIERDGKLQAEYDPGYVLTHVDPSSPTTAWVRDPALASRPQEQPRTARSLPPDALDLAAALEEAAIDLYAQAARIRTEAFRPKQDIAFVAIRAKGEARAVYDNLVAVFSACIPQAVEG